jgi:SPRY domain
MSKVFQEAPSRITRHPGISFIVQRIGQGPPAGADCRARHASARSSLFLQAHYRRTAMRLARKRQRSRCSCCHIQQPPSVHCWRPMCAVSSLLNPTSTSGTDGRAYGRAYYEITIVELKGCIQAGWASTSMRGSDLKSNDGVGDCPFSWAADGDRQLKWHLAHTGLWGGKWTEGDVIGIACDLNSLELSWCVLCPGF